MVLKGRIAIVTGASRGIGKATALALASKDCKVGVNYLKNEEAAKEVVEEIKRRGSEGILIKADVSIFNEVEKMVDKVVKEFKRIDILVNNAGIPPIHHQILQITQKEWDLILKVNLKGVFNCSKAVVKFMKQQGEGRIVNVASIVGRMGSDIGVAYASSKAGIIGLTYALASELAPYGITVNCVAPGGVDTEWHSEEAKRKISKSAPLKRIAAPEEIAEAILFLLIHDYITGEVVNIDGGRFLKKYQFKDFKI